MMPQQTPIHLTWQTIQDAIDRSPRAWYGFTPRSIRQLDALMHSEQGNEAHDSELSNEQLFQVAQILVKNNRIQPHHDDPLVSITNALDDHRLRALTALYNARNWYDWFSDGLMNQANFNAVAGHSDPSGVADALIKLNRAGLLRDNNVQANRDAVAAHSEPADVADALSRLNRAGLLLDNNAQANFNAVAAHSRPFIVTVALRELNRAGLLQDNNAQANFNAVAAHSEPADVADALSRLNRAGLLQGDNAQANFNVVAGHSKLNGVICALISLNDAGLLQGDNAQPNVDALLDPAHQWLTSQKAARTVWNGLPDCLLTQQVFNDLLRCARQDQPETTARRYVNHLIDHDPEQARQVLNDGQSTHTASVHRSVSDSAKKLYNRYQSTLNDQQAFSQTWKEISQWLNQLKQHDPNDDTVRAANQAWPRYYDYRFKEERSQVSMQQIIVCFWKAIHDPDNQQLQNVEDGKQALLQALYENQRAYNLDEQGKDDGQHDKPGCTSGQFNKFLEKMDGRHQDVKLIYVNEKSARKKLDAVVRESARNYLIHDLAMLETVRDDDQGMIHTLWPTIQDQVQQTMNNEFNDYLSEAKINTIVAEGENLVLQQRDLDYVEKQMADTAQPTQTVSPIQNLSIFHHSTQASQQQNDNDEANRANYTP